MINENVNFDENDEVTDEQYFSEDNDMNDTIITANNSSEDSYEESKIDEETITGTNQESEFDDNEYRVSRITDTFLKWECSIKNEQSKTVIKFRYRGEDFKGIVLQKINAMNYVFLVRPVGKGNKKSAEPVMKKIYIPDAELI